MVFPQGEEWLKNHPLVGIRQKQKFIKHKVFINQGSLGRMIKKGKFNTKYLNLLPICSENQLPPSHSLIFQPCQRSPPNYHLQQCLSCKEGFLVEFTWQPPGNWISGQSLSSLLKNRAAVILTRHGSARLLRFKCKCCIPFLHDNLATEPSLCIGQIHIVDELYFVGLYCQAWRAPRLSEESKSLSLG